MFVEREREREMVNGVKRVVERERERERDRERETEREREREREREILIPYPSLPHLLF